MMMKTLQLDTETLKRRQYNFTWTDKGDEWLEDEIIC